MQRFDEEALAFQERMIGRAGLGEETYIPVGAAAAGSADPACPCL